MTTEIFLKDDDITKTEDGFIFNPYNPLNTEIKLNDVQSILTKYGIPSNVYNMELYRRAFIHCLTLNALILKIYSKTSRLLKNQPIVCH